MKNFFYLMLAVALMWCGKANAQNVVLPYGQFTHQPWTGTFFFANSGEAGPAEDWFSKNYDDSSWDTIEGPISSVNGSIAYYNTVWQAEYGTYWVRRHFTVDDPSQVRELSFLAVHDDGCEAYLNGKLIYDYNGVYNHSVILDETARGFLTKGDNVLAIRVSDSGGIYAYLDCGIYGYSLINGTFDNTNAWTGSYDRHGYDANTIGYRYGQTFRCEQTVEGAEAGLYCLSANACGMEYYNDYNTAWAHRNDELPAKLFIGSYEQPIPSAFSEMADEDYGYCWNVGGQFVPYYVDRTPWAFNHGMYKCELWHYVKPDADGKFTVGIYSNAPFDISRWAAWDNLDLTYYTENQVTTMLDSIVKMFNGLNSKPQNIEVKKWAASLVNNANAAKGYEAQGTALATLMQYEPIVRKSINAYAKMENARQTLAAKLANATSTTSPATKAEAAQLNGEVQSAYQNGTYNNDDVAKAIMKMEKMVEWLDYKCLEITVNVPGSLGDSILNHVENFVDVVSLRLSGTLNNDDLNTIKGRLSRLLEMDLTDVKMTSLPNQLFYQRTQLEIVRLPSKLESIGEYAFYQCYALRYIEFPQTLTTINHWAFSECDNLQEVILPEGITYIGNGAFYSCDNNKFVKLPSTLAIINSNAFQYNYNLKEVDFAEGLTHIYNDAFNQCYALNNVKLPTTTYYIGPGAFANNRSLSNIELNEGLFQIADNAFYDCDALREITLPSSLVLAYESPFDYCENLVKVTCLSIEPPYMKDQIAWGHSMEGRELYVPALSINAYKQTSAWDLFPVIKPIDYLPENIAIRTELHLTLPEGIPSNYKPNVELLHAMDPQYGCLTVNGVGTFSIANFAMMYDPNLQFNYYDRNLNYCSLVNNSHLRADNVSIDVYPRNDRWTFLTLPFDVKMSDIETFCDGTTNWVVRKYDGQKRANGETADTWVKLDNNDILNAGEGYIIQGSRYIGTSWQEYSGFRMKAINNTNKNNIFRTTDVTVALNTYESEFAHNRSWNLIGNPYPCYYDTRFMDFEAPITVWNMRNNTYTAYSPSDDSYILCPGEAFFVQRPVDNGNIVFSKDGRQTNRNVRTIEAARRVSNASPRTIINLSLSDGNNTDRTRIVLNDKATLQYEMDKDASKFMSTDATVPQLFTTTEGVDYAINERPMADGLVCLSAYIGTEGLYTIALTNEVNGYNVVLEDKASNKFVDLTADGEYTFSAEAGTYSSRFMLHFDNETTGIEDVRSNASDDATVYSVEGVKIVNPSKRGVYIQNGKKIMLNK